MTEDHTNGEPTTPRGSRTGPESQRLQGHWLLAMLGKRVLRPGGIALTRRMLAAARPSSTDRIVEFGPGVGRTAQILLEVEPTSYAGVDPNPEGRVQVEAVLAGHPQARYVVADAATTGLPDAEADLVVGEAMLTMQPPEGKAAIIAEAARILAPGGRYAIHELAFRSDRDPAELEEARRRISRTIKVGARPLTRQQWSELLAGAGLEVVWTATSPMRLLEPSRLVRDEGLLGALRFARNVRRTAGAAGRVRQMRQVFRAQRRTLTAVAIVARKPGTQASGSASDPDAAA
ncbi:methyltransferase domain-containing protein [Actinomyces howellii]|uniref:Phospholipid N-methyltransferase n=1 Tax=Actinomyces howellii TaxID=52771 RepID=A0A3S4T946_9ACTO|nr:methyltransferase domain-containing protein [Actinomyces howellii]VEG27057.1 Phospholipid N-methyltransferase [Actinomyces howellii]